MWAKLKDSSSSVLTEIGSPPNNPSVAGAGRSALGYHLN
jgi:hypothetical protein